MSVSKILKRFQQKKVEVKPPEEGDIVDLISKDKYYYASFEQSLSEKPIERVLQEINLGLKIHQINLEKEILTLEDKKLLFIPPKYEFWAYFLIAINLSQLGYETRFLYHNWSRPLIDLVRPNLNYLKYQNLSFENLEDYDFLKATDCKILNFSESIRGIPTTVPSFSTALVLSDADLDYVLAYIFDSTFSFAGLKKSSLKRVIVDESIKEEFFSKLQNRLVTVDIKNEARIRSLKLRQQIHELVSDGISEGADLIIGSGEFEDDKYSNIILNDIGKDFRIFQKKFYGPVLLLSYADFEDIPTLKGFVQQQPSKGIVVFSGDMGFDTLGINDLKDRYDFVVRPPLSETEYTEVIENYPSIEIMIKFLSTI